MESWVGGNLRCIACLGVARGGVKLCRVRARAGSRLDVERNEWRRGRRKDERVYLRSDSGHCSHSLEGVLVPSEYNC